MAAKAKASYAAIWKLISGGLTLAKMFGAAISALLGILVFYCRENDVLWVAVILIILWNLVVLDVIVHRQSMAEQEIIPKVDTNKSA